MLFECVVVWLVGTVVNMVIATMPPLSSQHYYYYYHHYCHHAYIAVSDLNSPATNRVEMVIFLSMGFCVFILGTVGMKGVCVHVCVRVSCRGLIFSKQDRYGACMCVCICLSH
jgi:hypothetical protein